MSEWMPASFRIVFRKKLTNSQIEELIGHERTFNDLIYEFATFENREVVKRVSYVGIKEYFFLPIGSEGTLNITCACSKRRKTVVYVGGSLRDVHTATQIRDWFNKIVEIDKSRDVHIIKSFKGWAVEDSKTIKFKYRSRLSKEDICWIIRSAFLDLSYYCMLLKRRKNKWFRD